MQGLILFLCLCSLSVTLDPQFDLLNQKFCGQWRSSQQPFGYLDQTSGNLELIFGNQQAFYTKPIVNSAELVLLDPQYRSYKMLKFKLPLDNYDQNTRQWAGVGPVCYQVVIEGKSTVQLTCHSSFKIQMLYTNERSQEAYQFTIQVQTQDPQNSDCKFQMQGKTQPHSNQIKIFYYCIFVSALSSISLLSLLIFYKKYSENNRALSKISIKCVSLVLTQLWYLVLVHLYLLIEEKNDYGFFMIPILLIAIQSAVTLKLLLSAFRAKYQNNLTRRKWLVLVITLVVLFNGYILLMYLYPYDMLTVLLQSCVIIFQIVKNSKHYRQVKISGYYFIGCFGLQFVLGLYYRGCPYNIFSVEPSIGFVFFWNAIYAVQSVILLVQRSIGGRFFIPQCVLRPNTGYSLMKEDKPQQQCGICIGSFSLNEEFARTKCGHSYHQYCLKEWLKVNQKCPMCRTKIQQL